MSQEFIRKTLEDITGFKNSHHDFNALFSLKIGSRSGLNLRGIDVQHICEKIINEDDCNSPKEVKIELLNLLEYEVQKREKKCIVCQADILDSANFCTHCGKKISNIQEDDITKI